MIIGIPKEIMIGEARVAASPDPLTGTTEPIMKVQLKPFSFFAHFI